MKKIPNCHGNVIFVYYTETEKDAERKEAGGYLLFRKAFQKGMVKKWNREECWKF